MAAKSPADYIPGQQEAPVQLTSLRDMLNWAQNYARSRSIWPLGYGLACCAIEMIAAGQAHYDLSRFGVGGLPLQPAPGRPDDRRRHRLDQDGAAPRRVCTSRCPIPSG